jgi:hypothetical protein
VAAGRRAAAPAAGSGAQPAARVSSYRRGRRGAWPLAGSGGGEQRRRLATARLGTPR